MISVKYNPGKTYSVLNKMTDSFNNMHDIMDLFGQHMMLSIDKNFNVGGRPKWQPRTKTYSWPILVKSAALRLSVRYEAFAFSLRLIGGEGLPYADAHQYGTGKMPARPYIVVQQEDIDEFESMTKEYFINKWMN
jgi:phage gpG-like protein